MRGAWSGVPEEDAASLENRQRELTEAFLALRAEGADDPKAKRKLSRLAGKLDALYWARVEALLVGRVSPDRDELEFSEDERLLIDVGLLDLALVENAGDDLAHRLSEEIHTPGPPNHMYLSEWLEDRYRRHALDQDLDSAVSDDAEADGSSAEAKEARAKIFARMGPLFESLPGVSPRVARYVASGGLDEQILQTSTTLLTRHEARLFRYRRKLVNLRAQVVAKARARARDQATRKLFDMLENIYASDWRKRFQRQGQAENQTAQEAGGEGSPALSRTGLVEYLVSELHFVRTLLPLGALAGGVTRTCAVLLEDSPRVTKGDTQRGLALTRACDREYQLNPVVLIAPFRGRGIFEWDRDSLVVSLVPVESAVDSVANAVGNYRMLIDSFQNEGSVRKAYEERFPGVNFQQAFQADYRAWITEVGLGHAEGLPEERRDFFQQYIGPDCCGVLAPANLRNLGPQARETVRRRLEKQVSISQNDANLHHRLAVVYWQEGRLGEALAEMAQAAKLAPREGEILFGLGLLLRAQGAADKATGVFRACAKRVPQTIWGVYAGDAAAGRLWKES